MYKVLKRTCRAIVLPISSFVFPCPRCCRRRGLLKVPILPRTAKKYTRSSNAGTELLFCSLNLLFASSSLPSPSWFTKGPYLQL